MARTAESCGDSMFPGRKTRACLVSCQYAFAPLLSSPRLLHICVGTGECDRRVGSVPDDHAALSL